MALLFSLRGKKLFSLSLKLMLMMCSHSLASLLRFHFALPFAFHIMDLPCPDILSCQEEFILPESE